MNPTPCTECETPPKGQILYQDEESVILIPEPPALEGHIQVASKHHGNTLSELSPEHTQHLFHLANYAAASLFEIMQAQGTNILLTQGFEGHVKLNVLSRKLDDGVNFQWPPKPLSPAEMDETAQKIRDALPLSETKKETKPTPAGKPETTPTEKIIQIEKELENVKEKIIDTEEKENYLLKQLERIP